MVNVNDRVENAGDLLPIALGLRLISSLSYQV